MELDFASAAAWRPGSQPVTCLDAHTGGEPFRVVIAGGPEIPGDTMLDKRRWAEAHADALRRFLMWEPRGHADMYGCFLTGATSLEADFGILFMHNAGFSTMCGHGIIAVSKVVLDTGMLPASQGTLTIDTPAGPIRARATRRGGLVERVAFENVASFVTELDARVEVPGFGDVRYDLAFGGAFYAFVDAPVLGLDGEATGSRRLIAAGRAIKTAIAASRAIGHPRHPELGFLYGVIFVAPAEGSDIHSRHVCVFADGELDRSPTGTGVSARLALLHARGDLGVDESIVIESIVGSRFHGRVLSETSVADHAAIVPEIEGRAALTGRHEFFLDPADPFPEGFLLR